MGHGVGGIKQWVRGYGLRGRGEREGRGRGGQGRGRGGGGGSAASTCDLEPSRSCARKRKPLDETPLKPELFSEQGTRVRPSAAAAARTWWG